MTPSSLSFGGTISQNYEDYLGDFLFEPFAADLATRLDLTGVSAVLELACGTGRLTKNIVASLPASISFTASDLNPDMLSVAKEKVTSGRVNWATADMLNLPFGDGCFDLVVCQFGIMLVPEPWKALGEIFRVLKPGGKVAFSTWTDRAYNRVWAIGDEVLTAFFGADRISGKAGPFALGDQAVVTAHMEHAGFSDVSATIVTCIGEIESAEKAAYGFIHGLPIVGFINSRNPQAMPQILKAMGNQLRTELGDHPLKAPQKAIVFKGTK